jgi:hypothetical protein
MVFPIEEDLIRTAKVLHHIGAYTDWAAAKRSPFGIGPVFLVAIHSPPYYKSVSALEIHSLLS